MFSNGMGLRQNALIGTPLELGFKRPVMGQPKIGQFSGGQFFSSPSNLFSSIQFLGNKADHFIKSPYTAGTVTYFGPPAPGLPWPLANPSETPEQQAIGNAIQKIVEVESRNAKLDGLWELSPTSVKALVDLKQDPNILTKHQTAIQFMLDRQLYRMNRTVPNLPLRKIATDSDGVILHTLTPEVLTQGQLELVQKMVTKLVDRVFRDASGVEKRPSQEKLMVVEALADRFAVGHHFAELELIKPQLLTVTNGVVHHLLPNRVGPPLKNLTMATYNLEHFSIVQYNENKLNPPELKKYSPEKQVIEKERLFDKMIEAVLGSLSKLRRLGETLMHLPHHDETSSGPKPELPDLVAFQEVKNIQQLRYFLRLNHLEERYPNILFYPAELGHDGLAVISTDKVRLHSPNRVHTKGAPRPSGEVMVDLGDGREFALFNVHFRADKWGYIHSLGARGMTTDNTSERLREAASIGNRVAELIRQRPELAYVMVGDCNGDESHFVNKMAHLTKLRDVPQKKSQASHPNGNLDRVLLGGKIACEKLEVIQQADDRPTPPSDHKMMRIRLNLK